MHQTAKEIDPATIEPCGDLTAEGLQDMSNASIFLAAKLREAREARVVAEEASRILTSSLVGKVALITGVPNFRGHTMDEHSLNAGHISEKIFITKFNANEMTDDGVHAGVTLYLEGYNEQYMRVFGIVTDELFGPGLGLTIEAIDSATNEE